MSIRIRKSFTCDACTEPFSGVNPTVLLCPNCKEQRERARVEKRRSSIRAASRSMTKSLTTKKPDQTLTATGREFTIAKVAPAERLVFGYAQVSVSKNGKLIDDLQGDIVSPRDLERAAYRFMQDYGTAGEMHVGPDKGRVIESFVITPEKLEAMGAGAIKDQIPPRWWIGVRVLDDAVWKKVESGTYRMFSVFGTAIRVPVDRTRYSDADITGVHE